KRRSIKQEFSAATAHLKASQAASFTIRLGDTKGNLAKLANKDKSTPAAVTQAILKGSVTITVDTQSAVAMQAATCTAGKSSGLGALLSKAAMSISVKDDQAQIAELRLVGGDLYAYIGLQEIGRLAKAGGADNFDQQLDQS